MWTTERLKVAIESDIQQAGFIQPVSALILQPFWDPQAQCPPHVNLHVCAPVIPGGTGMHDTLARTSGSVASPTVYSITRSSPYCARVVYEIMEGARTAIEVDRG